MGEIPTVLVIQARVTESSRLAEQARVRPPLVRAGVRPVFANPHMDDPTAWRRHTVLSGGHIAVMALGNSDADHNEPTPLQLQYDELALPVIRRAMDADEPVMGICYGNQAMGRALEPEAVVRDPRRMEGGTGLLRLTTEGRQHVIFRNRHADPLPVTVVHKDSTTPPHGAVILGGTERDPDSTWMMGNNIGLPWHPEVMKGEEVAVAIANSRGFEELDAYPQTYPIFDTGPTDQVLTNFALAAVRREI